MGFLKYDNGNGQVIKPICSLSITQHVGLLIRRFSHFTLVLAGFEVRRMFSGVRLSRQAHAINSSHSQLISFDELTSSRPQHRHKS